MNSVYSLSPDFLKTFWVSTAAWYKKRQKYGTYYHTYFRFLLNTDPEHQEKKASEELEAFLIWVKNHLPVYAIPGKADIYDLPIINKSWVIDNYSRLVTGKPYKVVKSSGTSGQPLAVPYNKAAYQKEYAFWWYHRSLAGVKQGDRVATFMGHKVIPVQRKKPPFWVMNYSENQLIFSSYHLSTENLKYYINRLNRFQPEIIHAYPSSIYLVAKYLLENHIQLDFTPKMIQAASETTLDYQRRVIEEAFGTKLYIWYGNTEYCGHITECPEGHLHIQPYHSFVRIVNGKGKDVEPGEEGFIVATNFTNRVFPLINYHTGDAVRLSANQECSCGQGGRIVDYIVGRIEDYIVTPDGRYIGRLDHLFKDAKFVRNAQLEQRSKEELIVRIEPENGYGQEVENAILKEARQRLGNEMAIRFEYVKEIPRNKNGKFNFIIQNLNMKNLIQPRD